MSNDKYLVLIWNENFQEKKIISHNEWAKIWVLINSKNIVLKCGKIYVPRSKSVQLAWTDW